MKILRIFLFILSLMFPALIAISSMIVLEYSTNQEYTSIQGEIAHITSWGDIHASALPLFPYLGFAVALLLLIFLALNFTHPKASGMGVIITCSIYLAFLYLFQVKEEENMLHYVSFFYIYIGFFIFLIAGSFKGIYGRKHYSDQQLALELQKGGKLVRYSFAFSIIVQSYQKSSPVYFVPARKRHYAVWLWSAISLIFGLWGIPWGIIFTAQAIKKNFEGGEVLKG